MISVKFPFDIKYVDSLNGEALIVNLTSQGSLLSEKQCVDIILKLLDKENSNNVLVYNPEKFDSQYLMTSLSKKLNSTIGLEERIDYGI